tara:strand:- start:393 stop:1052 length:660 start_codon:yes stop_codon:yes gene_type:complete
MNNLIKIAPSILSANFSSLGEEISKLDKTDCDLIHIDVMDGHFVPNLSFGPTIIKSIRHLTKKPFDVHLMINPVKKFLQDYIDAGADIITIHHEIDDDVIDCIKFLKKKKIKIGISIKPKTNYRVIKKYLNLIDIILIMTVEPGFGGQSFIKSQIEKIKKVKALIGKKKIKIEVDGGINVQTAKESISAGAEILVAGSSVFMNGDYQKNILKLKEKKDL